MKQIRRVLISDISSYKAICIARFLKNMYPNVFVIGADARTLVKVVHTKYIDRFFLLDGPCPSMAYLKSLKTLLESESIDIFIPVNSTEITFLMKHIEDFESWLPYQGDSNTYALLNNKALLGGLTKKLSIRAPENYWSQSDIKFPAIVKPKEGSASKGVAYLKSRVDLDRWHQIHGPDHNEKYIFQQYLDGFGAGYSVFCVNGVIKKAYGHKRLCEYPISGGSSVFREAYEHDTMKLTAQKILEHTKWSGFAMFEFKICQEEAFLIEINPRIWGSINQGLEEGVNYFEPLFGPSNVDVTSNTKVRTYFSPLIYASLLGYLLHGQMKQVRNFFQNASANRPDISPIKDPMGYIGFLIRI